MKTLILTEVFPPQTGGSGRWFWEIYSRLPRDEYVIAAGEYAGAGEFDAGHDLDLHRLPLGLTEWGLAHPAGLRGYWRALAAVRRLPGFREVDQVHCGRLLPEGWMAWLLQRCYGLPYACYVHGEDLGCGESSRELGWLTRRSLASADYLIANTWNTRALLRDRWGVTDEKIHVMHPGVETGRFTPAGRDDNVRRQLGWGDRPVVLTVGRLQRRKGHDTLIRSLPAILQHVPRTLYAIAGDGSERDRLDQLASELGVRDSVQFLGEVDDEQLIRCYQQCDVFALPNRDIDGDIEGFGIVLLEAQACGKPVIAGKSGGTAETMSIPHSGCVVDCTTPIELADELVRLLRDEPLRREMGRCGREWVVERFDWSALVQQAEQLFTSKQIGDSSMSCAGVAE